MLRSFAILAGLSSLTVLAASCGDDDSNDGPGPTGGTGGAGGSAIQCEHAPIDLDSVAAPPIYTPRWAYLPWISKDISDGPDTYDFVDGFISRDIPVGVVVLDSPWETNYNTFIPNPDRYPNFEQMVTDLRAQDVRIVLWVTQMVNFTSYDLEDGGDFYDGAASNYVEGSDCGYYVNNGARYGWWKGTGAGVDFFHPQAAAWWHRQQDALLEMGINGWKLDFGESYILTDTIETASGTVSHQEYSEKYYEDFLAYGAAKRGADEFVTMVRPYDKSYNFEGRFFARPEHAPVAWVGDNRRDWVGLEDALDHIFRSADAGYVMVGSDLGGYLNLDDVDVSIEVPFDGENFAAWTAASAMTPFMQLHGRANLTPWNLPGIGDAQVPIYRYWAKLHTALIPLFYSLSEHAYAGRAAPPIRPIGTESEWAGDYRYMLGDAFLVAPKVASGASRTVALPANVRWYDWFDPTADAIDGGQTLTVDTSDIARIPLFVREGAIIPMDVVDDANGLGTSASAGHLTLLVYPSAAGSAFSIVEDDASTTDVTASAGATIDVTLSRALLPTIVRVRVDAAPSDVTLGGTSLADVMNVGAFDSSSTGWYYDATTRSVWIKVEPSTSALSLSIVPT